MSKRKAKQKEEKGFDPSTTKEDIAEDSPEVMAAVEKFNEEQQAHMADLDDEPTGSMPAETQSDEKPSEKPAETEQQSQPEAQESAKDTAKDESPAEAAEPAAEPSDIPESKPEQKPIVDETPPEEPKIEHVSGDRFNNYTVEVITDEGNKAVPLNNLVTTYQQFGYLQKKYTEAKPIYDLATKANVAVSQIMPFIELGLQTYMKQQNIVEGRTPPISGQITQPTGFPSGAQADTGGYVGPFKDAEQDAYYKEVDPDLYDTMYRNFRLAQSSNDAINTLRAEFDEVKRSRMAPPSGENQEDAQQKAAELFDKTILDWSGSHTNYFTAQNIGPARLEGFKNFIIRSHAGNGLKLKDLTSQFLQAEFARFDPNYNMEYLQKLAAQKAAAGKSDSGMFAEGSGVRGGKAMELDEQQKHMADM